MFYTINGKKNSKQMTNTVNLCILVVFLLHYKKIPLFVKKKSRTTENYS